MIRIENVVNSLIFKYCKKCGETKEFYSKRSVCKDCYKKEHKSYNKQYYLDHAAERRDYMMKYRRLDPERTKRIVDNYYKSPAGKFKLYKKEAKRRNISWGLTFEQFMTFWQKPCYYTGRSIETIGLDRVDSTKGYFIENVVSCHRDVNWAKNDMPQEEFLQMCKEIIKNLKLVMEK